jgi:hypothetical protein
MSARWLVLASVWAVGLVGAPAHGAEPASSLAASLRAELGAGGSVAVLGSYEGLIALSADGTRRRQLVPGKVFNVRVDHRGDVIWYRTEKTRTYDLMAIDLEAAKIAPMLVARDLGLMEEPDIAYADPDEVTPPGHEGLTLRLTRTGPLLERSVEPCTGKRRWDCSKAKRLPCVESPGKRCPTLEAAALPFLTTLGERGAGRSLVAPPVAKATTPRVELGEFSCRGCGVSTVIPGTAYWAVSTQAMGDFCHLVNQVYDPKTREFIDLDSGKRQAAPFGELGVELDDAWISAAGDAFIQGGVLHTFDHGRVPWKGPGEGGGFLDGGRWMPGRDGRCR